MKTPSTHDRARLRGTIIVSATGLALAVAMTALAAISGAIYTSLGDGTVVNQNLYNLKSDVYLNGGPQNEHGSGLPDGTYYFQVTDPSGGTLLSSDPAKCRQLIVAGGVVAGPTGPCPHAPGVTNPANGSTSVQLIPFDDTPNAGGEYKVWLIPTGAASIVGISTPRQS